MNDKLNERINLMDNALNFVRSKLDFSDNIIEQVANLLDNNFYGINSFFDNLFFNFNCNQCLILVTRRCFLLASWFLFYLYDKCDKNYYELIIDNDCLCVLNKENGFKNYIINDKGMFLLNKNESISRLINKAVLVDDVVIHGRNLESIKIELEKILSKYNDKLKVSKFAYMESIDTIVEPIDYSYSKVNKGEWTDLSERIVQFIAILNLPYVSYINSWTKYMVLQDEFDNLYNCLKQNKEYKEISFEDDFEHTSGRITKYFIEHSKKSENNETPKCFRLYFNQDTQICTIIPFVLLKSLDEIKVSQNKKIQSVYSKCHELLYKIPTYNNIENLFEVEYYMVSCVLSNLYAEKFFKTELKAFDILGKWENDVANCLLMTFGYDLSQQLKNIKINIQEEFKHDCADTSIESVVKLSTSEKVEDEYDSIIDKCENYMQEFCSNRWLSREYVVTNRTKDIPKFSYKELFKNWINTIRVQDKKNKNLNKYQLDEVLLAQVVHLCDIGRLSIASDKSRSDSIAEVGELAVLTVQETINSNDEYLNNKYLTELLNMEYYNRLLITLN